MIDALEKLKVRKDMEEEYGMLIMDYMKVIFIMI